MRYPTELMKGSNDYMVYNIWIKPYMPLSGEREPGLIYIPRAHISDSRLDCLDRTVYLYLCISEQFGQKYSVIKDIVNDIKTNPETREKRITEYLRKKGKTLDNVTMSEFNRIPNDILTFEDVKISLLRLKKFGYIE